MSEVAQNLNLCPLKTDMISRQKPVSARLVLNPRTLQDIRPQDVTKTGNAVLVGNRTTMIYCVSDKANLIRQNQEAQVETKSPIMDQKVQGENVLHILLGRKKRQQ